MSTTRWLSSVPRGNVVGLVAAVVVIVAVVVICLRPMGPPPDHHFDQSGIAFDYPGTWTIHDQLPPTTGFGSPVALLGTLPWGPCGPADINCHYQVRLAPGQIEVDVSTGLLLDGLCTLATGSDLDAAGPGDPARVSSFVRVAGRPTIRTDASPGERDYYLSDVWRWWRVAAPGTTHYLVEIGTKYRDPGTVEMSAALDRLIASLTLAPDVAAQGGPPADCGAPFPPAGGS
jgi:hypothetical protein